MLPDVASDIESESEGTLDWVGMTEVDLPILLPNYQGHIQQVPAKCQGFVSLNDPTAKGIHMSRLFLILQETLESEELSFASIQKLLGRFVESHSDLSRSSLVKIRFDYLVKRPALKSSNTGWRSYPITVVGRYHEGKLQKEIEFLITYSSTCPCSAALARQAIQQQFRMDFEFRPVTYSEVIKWLGTSHGVVATPHSQRSVARIYLRVDANTENLPLIHFIDIAEKALQTPVQAAVKREDEQEFALRNGQNLMFCEDAARRLKNAFSLEPQVLDYHIEATHLESLHPFNAVSQVSRGLTDGL